MLELRNTLSRLTHRRSLTDDGRINLLNDETKNGKWKMENGKRKISYRFSIAATFASLRRCRSSPVNLAATNARTISSASSDPTTRAPKQSTLQLSCSRD